MPSDRLHQLDTNLESLREQLGGMEEAYTLSPLEEQTRLKLRIKKLKAQIHEFEQEYWQTLAQESNQLQIAEPEAEVAIAEIVEGVTQIEAQPPATYSAEMLQLLRQIREELNQPGTPAAVKVKWVLSAMPPFVGLATEGELDLEKFLQTHFPTFRKWSKALTKK
jgi:regulator of replication initiation timing